MSEGVDLTHLLEFAEEVARRAGDLLLEGWRGSDGGRGLVTSTKSSPTDLVTELDRASEQLVASAIRDRRPEDGLLGEEGANRPTRSGLTWVIDPLDGTTNFVYGYGSFAVSIALRDDVGSLLGVLVHDPLRAETFTAASWPPGSSLDGCRLGPLVAALARRGADRDGLRLGAERRPFARPRAACWRGSSARSATSAAATRRRSTSAASPRGASTATTRPASPPGTVPPASWCSARRAGWSPSTTASSRGGRHSSPPPPAPLTRSSACSRRRPPRNAPAERRAAGFRGGRGRPPTLDRSRARPLGCVARNSRELDPTCVRGQRGPYEGSSTDDQPPRQ